MIAESVNYGMAAIAAGIAAGGGAIAIGLVGGKALEALARQPEMMKDIRTFFILAAALAEGLGFFGAIVGLLVIFTK